MTFGARSQNNKDIEVFDALTGQPWFKINTGKTVTSYFVSSFTLVVNYENGSNEVWDLNKRSKIR